MWLHLGPYWVGFSAKCVRLFLHPAYLTSFFLCQIEMVHFFFVHSANIWAPTQYLRSCRIHVLDWVLGIEQCEKQNPYSPVQLGRKTNTNRTYFIVSVQFSRSVVSASLQPHGVYIYIYISIYHVRECQGAAEVSVVSCSASTKC